MKKRKENSKYSHVRVVQKSTRSLEEQLQEEQVKLTVRLKRTIDRGGEIKDVDMRNKIKDERAICRRSPASGVPRIYIYTILMKVGLSFKAGWRKREEV